MKSPFPGMDPYLEERWAGVHTTLITYARDQLRPQMPDALRVDIEESVSVRAENDERELLYRPDVHIHEAERGARRQRGDGRQALAEPMIVPLAREPRTRRSLRIVDFKSQNRVVTIIEFLSPWNKRQLLARQRYRKKRRDSLRAKTNWMEIDLTRSGPYVLLAPLDAIASDDWAVYQAWVWRATRPRRVEYYPLELRKRLPTIRVPLRPRDEDAALDLQALIDETYERGYSGDIDYDAESIPPLSPTDAAWADKLLHAKGLR